MNRAEVIRQIFLWEQVAEKAQERANKFRAMLQADANAEFEEQGIAPTWRLPEVASASLPISQPRVTVDDENALAKWAAINAASEVQMRVNPAYVSALKKNANVEGDQVTTKDGTVIPGLGVKPGGRPQSVRLVPEPEAKAVAGEAAEVALANVAAALNLAAPEPVEQAGDADA